MKCKLSSSMARSWPSSAIMTSELVLGLMLAVVVVAKKEKKKTASKQDSLLRFFLRIALAFASCVRSFVSSLADGRGVSVLALSLSFGFKLVVLSHLFPFAALSSFLLSLLLLLLRGLCPSDGIPKRTSLE